MSRIDVAERRTALRFSMRAIGLGLTVALAAGMTPALADSTTTVLGLSQTTAPYGNPVMLTARVNSKTDATGSVQFNDGVTPLGSPVPLALATGTGALALGTFHTCAINTAGGVLCWGDNTKGQLGIGTSNNTNPVPQPVFGLSSGVVALTAGREHTCALTTAGAVKCWGANDNGQLGIGTVSSTVQTKPKQVTGLTSGVAAIAAGDVHTCALLTTSAVKCWGNDYNDQLGDGHINPIASTPVDVVGLSNVTAVAAGGLHTCAIASPGNLYCWGSSSNGEVGDGTIGIVPLAVKVRSAIADVTAGSGHTCAVTTAGAVLCWGQNFNGEIGDGTKKTRAKPTKVSGLGFGVVSVSAGSYHTCALTAFQTGVCWGANGAGQIGDGTTGERDTFVAVAGLNTQTAIVSGGLHSCSIGADGKLLCWGRNISGEIGDGTYVFPRKLATAVTGNFTAPVSRVATLVKSNFTLGAHTITAAYLGNASHTTSTSPSTPLTVVKVTPTLVLTATPASSSVGQLVAFTATTTGIPDGTSVAFTNGGQPLGTATVTADVAVLKASTLTLGTHAILVSWAGNATHFSAHSDQLNFTVN